MLDQERTPMSPPASPVAPGHSHEHSRHDDEPDLLAVSAGLLRALDGVPIGAPAAYVYNPLVYAQEPHEAYLRRYGGAPKEVVFLGMNPGPFGMAQTGVPFGEVALVRDWLGISGRVGHPVSEHPRRPVEGFACHRSEVSGRRLWGWIRATFGEPECFFARFFVANYCPLLFLDEAGRNLTPDRLAAADRKFLFAACDAALVQTVAVLRPRLVVGIGRFAEERARTALAATDVTVVRVTHPSPANPAANRGWQQLVVQELAAAGVALP
jgi:single-strand selective monofunctional uracil DNA glycosylase